MAWHSSYASVANVTDDTILLGADCGTTATISIGSLRKCLKPDRETDRYDLAGAVLDFYKRILDAPLSADMLEEWEQLSAHVTAIVEMAGKYVPLVEAEITAKIDI